MLSNLTNIRNQNLDLNVLFTRATLHRDSTPLGVLQVCLTERSYWPCVRLTVIWKDTPLPGWTSSTLLQGLWDRVLVWVLAWLISANTSSTPGRRVFMTCPVLVKVCLVNIFNVHPTSYSVLCILYSVYYPMYRIETKLLLVIDLAAVLRSSYSHVINYLPHVQLPNLLSDRRWWVCRGKHLGGALFCVPLQTGQLGRYLRHQ